MSQPEYITIREFGECVGISHRTLERCKSEGFLPPHFPVTSRHHRWRRRDVDAWMTLKQRGLWGDWLELRGEHGSIEAWEKMLKRLDDAA